MPKRVFKILPSNPQVLNAEMRPGESDSTLRLRMIRPRRGPNEKIPWVLRSQSLPGLRTPQLPAAPRWRGNRGGGRKGSAPIEAPPAPGWLAPQGGVASRAEAEGGRNVAGGDSHRVGNQRGGDGGGRHPSPKWLVKLHGSARADRRTSPSTHTHTSTQRRRRSPSFPSSHRA